MNREEARKRLEVYLICAQCPEDKQCYDAHLHSTCEYNDCREEISLAEAVKTAIKGLEQLTSYEQTINKLTKAISEQEPCEDVISREPFTDSTICEGFSCDECSFNRKDKGGCILEERVMNLPSAKQKPKTIQEIQAESEKYQKAFEDGYEQGYAQARFDYEQEPCEDAISRKSIKQKLQEHHDFFISAYGGFSNLPQNDKSRVDEITNCIAMVVNEPPVKLQELKTGHWILADEQNKADVENDNYRFICSECQCSDIHAKGTIVPYCWKCGAKMGVVSE